MGQDTLGRTRLEEILRFIGEGVIYQEADGKIRFFNRTAQRIFGIGEEQALGRTSMEPDWYLIHEDGSICPGPEHPSMITLRTGQALSDQIRGISRPGLPNIWLSINTIPIFGTDRDSPEAVVISFSDITERKRAEADFKRFFDLTPDLACIASTSGYFLKLNPAWRITLGYSEEELLAAPFLDFIHPDDREPTMAEVERQMAGGTTIKFVNRYRCKDGSYKWLEWRATPAVDRNLLYASARDITERKQAEEALVKQDRYLYAILQATADGFCMADRQGIVTQVNQAYCDMTGYTREELLGRSIGDLDAYERREDTKARIERITADGSDIFETLHRRKDGSIFPIEISATYLEEGGGQFVCFGRDQSQRRQNEESIALLGKIVDEAPASITIHDTTGRFLFANQKTLAMHGYRDLAEFLNINLHDLDLPESEALLDERFRKIGQEGEATFEVAHYRKDGSTFPLEVTVKKILWQGQPALLSIATDITERKRAEVSLARLNQRLQLFMDVAADGIHIHDLDGNLVEWSDSFRVMLGYDKEEMVGLKVTDWDIHFSKEELAQWFQEQLKEHKVFETMHRRRDGSSFPVEISSRAIQMDGKQYIYASARDITDRKETEAQRDEYQSILRSTLETIDSLIMVIDRKHRIILSNWKDHQWVPEEDRTKSPFCYQAMKHLEAPCPYCPPVRTFEDGQPRWYEDQNPIDGSFKEISVQPIFDQQGRVQYVLENVRDITDRKKAEDSLKQSEEKFRALFISNPNGIALVETGNQRFLQANKSFLDMLGYGEEELYRLTVRDVTHPDDWEAEIGQIGKQLGSKGSIFDIKKRYLRKDGEIIWVRVTGDVIRLGENEPLLAIANVEDVTESQLTEKELGKQRQRLAGIIEGANVGTWEWNVQTGEAIFNERWAEIIGYTLEELAPVSIDTWKEHVHPDDLDASNQRLARHFGGELDYYDCECRMRHKDGHWVWVLDRGKVISRTDEGEPLWMFGTHIDITELKRAEKEQVRLQAQLAQAQKMDALGTLSSGIAHDFNNILAAILGYSELALDELPENNLSVRQDLAAITNAAMKAKNLVRQILTFSRVAEGQRRPLSVGRVAQEARAILERTLPKMIDLRLDLQEELWPVNADPQQMEQVFINLAVNAADAIEGSGTVTIGAHNLEPGTNFFCQSCGKELADRWVLITVKDEGKGMSPEVLAKIFEPFYTTKGVGKGTGLGLSTVYGIVSGHGGHVYCQSKEGEGSTFFIYLPANLQGEPVSEPEESDLSKGLSGSGKILVVDDEPAVRDIAQKILTRSGYEVLQAANGEEALTIYQEQSQEIDLVLLDLGMPGMGGKACLAEIRRLDPDARVLIASGYIQYEITDELESLGAGGMVSKPYRKADILKAVKEALGS